MPPLTCDVRPEELSAFADGELRGASEAALRAHVDRCARCRRTLDAWRGAAERMRSGDATARAAGRVRRGVRRRRATASLRSPRKWAAVAAALGVGIALSILESRARAEREGIDVAALESQNRIEAARQRACLEALRLELASIAVRVESSDVAQALEQTTADIESLHQRILQLDADTAAAPFLGRSHASKVH